MSEHHEQCALFTWLRLQWPELDRVSFAIPNGGHRHKAVAGKLKAEGVKAGVPDVFIAHPTKTGHAGLFIEMKTAKGYANPAQKAWQGKLRVMGFAAEVCKGIDAARDCVNQHYGDAA